MASVDPYAPCPCGSGQKYKWCCQKVEAYAERAQRMVDSGQFEASLKPLEEGLAKFPDNAWLLSRKSLVEAHLKRYDAARSTLDRLLDKYPGHPGGTVLATRLLLETGEPEAAIGRFQQGLSALPAERRREAAPLAHFLGVSLGRAELPIAALKHLELAARLAGDDDKDRSITRSLASQRVDPQATLWEKNPYRLRPVPEGVTDAFRESFRRALGWAEEGLWASAASAFELLSAGSSAGAAADHNRGLCCLWIADHAAAIAALRRYIARTGPTTESVDLEALCQLLESDKVRGETVEFVQLSWPVRDRPGLLRALEANPHFERGPGRPIRRDDPEAPDTDRFFLLDRPRIEARPGLTRRDIPLSLGEVIIGPDVAVLETYDDGRLDRLMDRFTAAAGTTIPPAHPRTKLIERVPRHMLAMSWQWSLPKDLSDRDAERLNREQRAHILAEVWPETPNPVLGRRTPIQAARAGDAETALRASIRLLEVAEPSDDLLDWAKVRERLGVPPEPAADPRTLDLDRLHLTRWSLIPLIELEDDRLLDVYRRSADWGMHRVRIAAARVIVDRPGLPGRSGIDPVELYGGLALDAAGRDDREGSQEWFRRGREAESQRATPRTLEWELAEFQASTLLDGPESWVPTIVGLLERYRDNPDASSAVLYRLIRLGLVRPLIDPDRPGQVMLDMGVLDRLIAEYGPRVTTAASDRGEIWTPESARGGAAIWTPGSESVPAAGQERPRLILPGQ